MIPSFNAAGIFLTHPYLFITSIEYTHTSIKTAPYSSAASTTGGLTSPDFMNTYAFLFITMAVLMLIFLISATRTNIVYTLIFLSLLLVFLLLSSGYWTLGQGNAVVGDRCVKGAGAALFVASLLGFYLLIAQLFDAVGFPATLPVGDLEGFWPGSRNENANVERGDVEEKSATGAERT
ncbi:hypothetical protein BDV12DRAFT_200334 [Aspergillus spectabilis]